MLKILLVSNNTGYTNEIKRSAILADVDILANYPSIHDVQRNIDQFYIREKQSMNLLILFRVHGAILRLHLF